MNEHHSANNIEHSISCSFCQEKFASTKEMGDHLLMCGNKTDPCPKCNKYIRRAVFAYHYENDCADVRMIDNDGQPPIATTTSNSSPPNTENSAHQPSRSIISVTMLCPFCNYECDPADIEVHQRFCLQNPDRIGKRTTTATSGDSIRHADEQSSDNALIPCEYCQKPIEWRLFDAHARSCQAQERERWQQQQQSSFVHTNYPSTTVRCRYCNTERYAPDINFHESICSKPGGYSDHVTYVSCFRLP